MTKIEDQLKEIRDIVYKNKATTERLEGNWDNDRKDFSEFQNRLGHLEEEFRSLKELVLKMPQRTQDKVAETVQPMMDQAYDLQESIDSKKTMVIKEKPKSLWRKIFRKR